MTQHKVRVKSIVNVTHNVLKIVTEKPSHYIFAQGQATDVTINKSKWKTEKRPFTFTGLQLEDYLEFTVKIYPSHKGVTNQLLYLEKDDELILHEVFGAIDYKAEGIFIAGGAGVAPFISIFKYLKFIDRIGNNKLIFANKTKADIILEKEFKELLGDNFINILSDEVVEGYSYGYITESFLKDNIGNLNQYFYLCGPPPMIEAVEKLLIDLKVDTKYIVKEKI